MCCVNIVVCKWLIWRAKVGECERRCSNAANMRTCIKRRRPAAVYGWPAMSMWGNASLGLCCSPSSPYSSIRIMWQCRLQGNLPITFFVINFLLILICIVPFLSNYSYFVDDFYSRISWNITHSYDILIQALWNINISSTYAQVGVRFQYVAFIFECSLTIKVHNNYTLRKFWATYKSHPLGTVVLGMIQHVRTWTIH